MDENKVNSVPSDEKVEQLIHALEGFGRAYPTDMFIPLTTEERKSIGDSLLTRASADMGRHCAKFMTEAAAMIKTLHSELQEARQAAPATGLQHAVAHLANVPEKSAWQLGMAIGELERELERKKDKS